MRKTLLYIVILALLGFSIYYFIFNNNDTPYSKKEAGFTIKDTSAVGKLYIVSSTGEAITAVRTDSGWVVNNTYKALASTLNLLLTTLNKQTALYPVTKSAYENAVKAMSTDGIKVEVYDRKGKAMSIFYVGGASLNGTGANMLMQGATEPYVVQIPGFNGYLSSRYTTRLTDWRDRTVFNMPQEEIKSVSVQYADKPINSFVISRDANDSINVEADKSLITGLQGINKRRAVVYLRYFTDVNCEGYLNGLSDMEATLKAAPKQSTIDILGKHGQHEHADIYWMALNERSKNRQTSNPDVPDDYDSDRLYAVINNGKDTVMIQQFAFRNIFHKAYEFFQHDKTAPAEQGAPKPAKNLLMHKTE